MKERQNSIGDIINELSIIREQLKHPNVVRYYRTFISGKHNSLSHGKKLTVANLIVYYTFPKQQIYEKKERNQLV